MSCASYTVLRYLHLSLPCKSVEQQLLQEQDAVDEIICIDCQPQVPFGSVGRPSTTAIESRELL